MNELKKVVEFKKVVYRLAHEALQGKIKAEETKIEYWNYVFDNYPGGIGSYTTPQMSPHGHETASFEFLRMAGIFMRKSKDSLVNKKKRLLRGQANVDEEVLEIYDEMTDRKMTHRKLWRIAIRLNSFMKITGKPWIEDTSLTQWSAFLLREWDEKIIPANEEAVWTKIPEIAASFMSEFNIALDSGVTMPGTFPMDDGYINSNLSHTDQEYNAYD